MNSPDSGPVTATASPTLANLAPPQSSSRSWEPGPSQRTVAPAPDHLGEPGRRLPTKRRAAGPGRTSAADLVFDPTLAWPPRAPVALVVDTGLTPKPHHDQQPLGCLTWVVSPATGID